jgi:hypothetical protein
MREVRDGELQDFCSSTNINRMMDSRTMIYVGHVERMGRKERAQRGVSGKSMEKKQLGISRCKVIYKRNLDK